MDQTTLQKSELWEISHKLIGFDTVSTKSNREAIDYLANYLKGIGFTVHKIVEIIQGIQKCMIIAWIGPEVPDGLIICGHTDVVPFDGQPGWQTDPLEMTLKGEHIIARGVSDMKVFIAQALLAHQHWSPGSENQPGSWDDLCAQCAACAQACERRLAVLDRDALAKRSQLKRFTDLTKGYLDIAGWELLYHEQSATFQMIHHEGAHRKRFSLDTTIRLLLLCMLYAEQEESTTSRLTRAIPPLPLTHLFTATRNFLMLENIRESAVRKHCAHYNTSHLFVPRMGEA